MAKGKVTVLKIGLKMENLTYSNHRSMLLKQKTWPLTLIIEVIIIPRLTLQEQADRDIVYCKVLEGLMLCI